jgi:signal transduction histidine kinase
MATTAGSREASRGRARPPSSRLFHWSIALLCIAALAQRLAAGDAVGSEAIDVLAWVLASLLADLMTVQLGRGIHLSMSVPVLLAAAMIHPPAVAAVIGFLGCLDVDELRGRIRFEAAVFNRAQIALAVAASSAAMAAVGWPMSFPTIVALSALGLIVDGLVNVTLVASSLALAGKASIREVILGLFDAEPLQSLALYACMCLVAPLLVLIYVSWGPAALVVFSLLVLPFRLTLVKIRELGEVALIARLREVALERAETAAATERLEERQILAGDLHDEVLPPLYQVHLMGEVLKQDLAHGRLLDLDEDLPALLEATNVAQGAVRRYVKGLRLEKRSIRDVAGAIRACVEEIDASSTRFEMDLESIDGSERCMRTLVQVAREAIVNSARYASSSRIRIRLFARDGIAQLSVSDDGVGFELAGVDVAEHFGLQLMRERVEGLGGRLTITSAPGQGTSVSALVPLLDPG